MPRPQHAPWLLLAGLTLAHFALLANCVRPAYSAIDADGYYAQARLLAFEGRPDFEPEAALQHLGVHWLEKGDGRFISRYPPGLPILLGAVWKVFGRDASLYVNALLAALTLPLVFLLCRPYARDWPALAAAFVQAANPAANRQALNANSHSLTTVCLVGGYVLLDRWSRRGGRWTGFAAGFVLAYIPLVRFAEAAAALGVIAFLFLIRHRPERRAEIPYVLAGALQPTLALAAHNQFHFGAFWRTAYELTGESALSLEYLLRNWPVYSQSLLTSGVGYFIPLALMGLLLMLRDRETRPVAAALGLSAASVTLLYCSYYYAEVGSPVTIRFLLPTLPLYFPPALYLLRQALPIGLLGPALGAILLLQTTMGQPAGIAELRRSAAAAERSAAAIAGLEGIVAPGAVLLGDRRLHEQLNFTGAWKLADAEPFFAQPRERPLLHWLESDPANPNRPSPMQRGKGAELRARVASLSGDAGSLAMLRDLESWAGDEPLYWVVPADEADRMPDALPGYNLDLEARIELPRIPEARQRDQRIVSPLALTGEPLIVYRLVARGAGSAASPPSGKLQ